MGALDKRIFSGVAIISALLFIVSAVMLFASDSELGADDTSTALYILTVAGILAIVYSVSMLITDSSFVRKVAGVLLFISGILYLAVAFVGGSADTVLAVAGIVAGLALVADMLALWVSRVYGAMYVSAVLAAVNLVMGIMLAVNGYSQMYALIMLVAFAVWLAIGAWVSGFLGTDSVAKTREVVEDTQAQKKDKPQAMNKKATPKAKKAEKAPEAPQQEEPKAEEAPAAPAEEKAEEKPKAAEPRKVRTVQLPKTQASQEAIQRSQAAASKTEKAPEIPKEVPKDEPKAEPAPAAPVAEEKAEEAPKQEQKPPAKAMGDFMAKLMKSDEAAKARAAEHPRHEEPAPAAPKVEEKPAEPVVEEKAEEKAEEAPKQEEPETTVPEHEVPAPMQEPEVPEESVIAAPVEPQSESDLFRTAEPNWDVVARDSSGEEVMRIKSSEPKAEPKVEEKPAEVPAEPVVEDTPAPVQEPETAEPAPAAEPEKEDVPAPEEKPAETRIFEASEPREAPAEPVQITQVDVAPETGESVISAPVEPAQEPEAPAAEPNWDVVARDTTPEETPEPSEDVYTDNSPEALVRRAAWNKGLRCRRGYGERNIPVAFVKGKVAVYVDDGEPDTSGDEELRAEGWTVLRYRAQDITDGKAQGDEIAAAVKENTKASKKKKARK